MAFVNFNHSANFSTALTNSTTSTNTLYFPSDYPTIIKNGKVFGIKSCTGPLSFNASTGILSHSNSGVTGGNYGPSANVSPSHGGTFTVPYISVNETGHIIKASNRTIILPNKISVSNHYSPTETHTIQPTNITYATFGDSNNSSVLIGPVIGADDKGHITGFEACRLPQIVGVGSTDVNVSDDGGTIYISSNKYIINSSVTPAIWLSPNETVVCSKKVNSIKINGFFDKPGYPIGHYKVVFYTSSSFSTLSVSPNIKWANNEIPSQTFNILPNKIYEMDFEAVTIANQKIIKGCLTYFG